MYQWLHGILFIKQPEDSDIKEIGTKKVAWNSTISGAKANELRKNVTDDTDT